MGEQKQQVLSFGCRLNIYESEVIKGHLPEDSRTLVVNTCAVTSEAERQARHVTRGARYVATCAELTTQFTPRLSSLHHSTEVGLAFPWLLVCVGSLDALG